MSTPTHIGARRIQAPHKEITADTKKYLAIGIIVILVVFGAFMLLNNAGNNKTDLAGGGGVPVGENDGLPIADSDSEISGPDTTAGEYPPEMVLNEETGEYEPEDKIPDEIGHIGEVTGYENVKGYKEYIEHYHAYYEADSQYSEKIWDNVDGFPLYMKILSLKEGEFFNFSVGYLDDNKWHEVKRYNSEKAEITSNWEGIVVYGYPGCFTKKDDSGYKVCSQTGFSVGKKIFIIRGTGLFVPQGEGKRYRSHINDQSGPLISSLSN